MLCDKTEITAAERLYVVQTSQKVALKLAWPQGASSRPKAASGNYMHTAYIEGDGALDIRDKKISSVLINGVSELSGCGKAIEIARFP